VHEDNVIDDGVVERLLAALADALRRTRKDPFNSPVTVAEIYQDLIPYRSVRTALGFQMTADYEHTVLRMLAGEKELARLEPEEAREELRAELDMPNPNVGLFRKFAACDVWILEQGLTLNEDGPPAPQQAEPAPQNPEPVLEPLDSLLPGLEPAAPEPAPDPAPEPAPEPPAVQPASDQPAPEPAPPPPAPEPVPAADQLPAETDLPVLELDTEPAAGAGGETIQMSDALLWAEAEPEGEWDAADGELILEEEVQEPQTTADTLPPPADAGVHEPTNRQDAVNRVDMSQPQGKVVTAQAAGSCAFCQGSLPGGRVIRFCPFCGADQAMTPCPSCREPLDPAWKFCIACGNQQG
jgi:hypothetical protein